MQNLHKVLRVMFMYVIPALVTAFMLVFIADIMLGLGMFDTPYQVQAFTERAPYIAQALESFLAQDVPIEILVHDDASTDGTQDILRDYARRYPDVVRPLFETENQYSRGVAIDPTFNYPRARGKYIALCEHAAP